MDKKIEKNRLVEEILKQSPIFKLGDIVIVHDEKDIQKAVQGIIKTAEFFREWFYGIEIANPTDEPTMIYTYEKDTGDAKTKIIIDKPV